jgi:hypothetical protein
MIIPLLYIFLSLTPASASPPAVPAAQPAGQQTENANDEELVYEVSWAHIKIATIQMHLTIPDGVSSPFIARAAIDSHSHLVNLHMIACSEMDSAENSLVSYSYEKKGNQWETMLYEYHPEFHCVLSTQNLQKDTEQRPKPSLKPDTLRAYSFPVQDGISLVYFMRRFVRKTGTAAMPTVSMGKVGTTDVYKERKRVPVEINSYQYPIRAVQLSGKLRLDGIFGLKGDFTAWFSDDEASVPLVATMKVLLGSVRLELKQWKHGTWQPPV